MLDICPQIGGRFLVDTSSKNVNGTPTHWASWLLTMYLHRLECLFSVWLPYFKHHVFHFQVYGNRVEENRMYQQLQNIRREKVCRIKVFRENLGKFSQKIFCTPPKLPAHIAISGVDKICLNSFIQKSLQQWFSLINVYYYLLYWLPGHFSS